MKHDDEKEAEEIAADLLADGLDLANPGSRPGFTEDPYPDYDSSTTRVISGPLGKAKFSGTRYQTWQEARLATSSRFCVVQFWTCGPRWFARVRVGQDNMDLVSAYPA